MITLLRNSPFLHRIYLESRLEKVTESQQWLISTLHPTLLVNHTIHTILCQPQVTIAQTKIIIHPQSPRQITNLPSQTLNHRPPFWQSYTRMYPFCTLFLLWQPCPQKKPPRTSGKSPYDSLGSCRRTYHRRKTRATRSPCPSKHLSSIQIC